jgi:hypothetical protein
MDCILAKKPECTVSHIMVTWLRSKWAVGKGSVSAGRRIGVSASQETRFRNVWQGTRSRAIPGSTSDGRVGCSASDRRWFPARPAQHVHRRRNNGKGRIQSTLASAHGRNGKRRVETYSAGRAGAHPYRRRQSGSVLQAFQNVCIGNQVSCLHEIHGYNRLPWPHPVDPIVRRIKSAGKLFEDRGE